MEDKQKDSIVKSIATYSSSNIYRRVLGVLNAYIKPKLLSPELYGLWNILNIIPSYASYSHLGSRSIMRYLIPYNMAKNEFQKNVEIKSSVFYGSLYLNVLISAILVIISFAWNLTIVVRFGLLTMAIMVILMWYYDYYLSLLKSYQNFKLITSTNYLRANITVFLGIILIYFFNIYGVFLSAILSYIFVILYLKVKYPLEPHGKFQFKVFIDLVKKGVPLTLYNFNIELILTLDRIIISYYLGSEQVGYYAIAIMIGTFLLEIPSVSLEIIEPKLMENMNVNSNENNLKEYFFTPLINTAYFMPFMLGAGIIVLPFLIPLLLPRYTPGILSAQIIILGSYFFSLSILMRGIIVANGWQLKASVLTGSILPISMFLSILLLKLGLGIEGVAIGSSISYFILFIWLLIFIRRRCNYVLPDWNQNLIAMCYPFPIMCVTITFLQYFSKIIHINDYIATFINLLIFFIIMFFVLNIAQKKYPLLKGIRLGKIWLNQ